MNWSPVTIGDVPAELVTRTSTTPGVSLSGEFAVIVVELTTVTLVAAVAPKATVAPVMYCVPVIVTAVPPAVGPELGLTDATVGVVAL